MLQQVAFKSFHCERKKKKYFYVARNVHTVKKKSVIQFMKNGEMTHTST